MVAFNPTPEPTQDPNYDFYSRPNSRWDYRANQSGGEALAGLGNIFKTAVAGQDMVVKNTIDQAIAPQVDTAREGFTGALEQIAGVPQDQRVADIQPDSNALNILPKSQTDNTPPVGVDSQLSGAGTAVSGLNNGKLSPLHYVATLDTIAKSLRSDYPGYRDYIDSKISSMTGMNPANAYYKELITGINAGLTKSQSALKTAQDYVLAHNGLDGSELVMQNLSKVSDPVAYVNDWAARQNRVKYTFDMNKAALDNFKGQKEELQIKAKDAFNQIATDTVNSAYTNLDNTIRLNITGPDGKPMFINGASVQQLNDYVQGVQKGIYPHPTDQQSQALLSAYSAAETSIRNKLLNQASTQTKNGTISSMAGDDYINSTINNKLSGLEAIKQDLVNKDWGMVNYHANASRAIADDTLYSLQNSKDFDLHTFFTMTPAVTKAAGSQGAGLLLAPTFQNSNIYSKFQTLLNDQKQKIITGNQDGTLAQNGQVRTLGDALDVLTNNGVGVAPVNPNDSSKGHNQIKDERKFIKDLVNLPATATNPSVGDDAKLSIYRSAFDPKNQSFISKFANDQYIPDPTIPRGPYGQVGLKVIPGNHMVFDQMTTPAVTNDVYRLSQKSDPTLWTNYVNWVANSHRQLFQQDLLDLNDAGNLPNVHLAYNSDNPGWTVSFDKGPPGNLPAYGLTDNLVKQKLSQTIALINSSLKPLVEVANREGKDPNAYIFQTLLGEGVDPTKTGIPSKMLNSVLSAQPGKTGTTQSPPTPQETSGEQSDNSNIKGAANAAKIGAVWGNPLSTDFSTNHLTEISTPDGQKVTVNKKSAEAFQGFLSDLENEGYKVSSIGGYNLRTKKSDQGSLSQHAFGNAIDINPEQNPYHSNKTNLPANVSDLAAKWGISWGGDWSKGQRDPMHFEFTGKLPSRGDVGYKLVSK